MTVNKLYELSNTLRRKAGTTVEVRADFVTALISAVETAAVTDHDHKTDGACALCETIQRARSMPW